MRLIIDRAPDERGEHVLYWMTMYRRPGWNFAFNFCSRQDDYDHYESLPAWARATLIFGTVRYMSSENAARKRSLEGYLLRYA